MTASSIETQQSPVPQRALVTGAGGYVAPFVIAHLQRAGFAVRGLYRRPPPSAALPPGSQIHADPGTEVDGWATLLADCDVLVHCAFSHVPGRYRGGEGEDPVGFWRDNLLTTVALLEAAARQRLQRVVLLSSRAVFDGAAPNPSIADAAPPTPTTHYGMLKASQEQLARGYAVTSALPVATLRLTGVYGLVDPVQGSKWYALLKAALSQQMPAPRRATEVHGDDVAQAVRLLLQAEPATITGRVFNCSDLSVCHRDLILEAQLHTQVRLPVPEAGPAVPQVLDCAGLKTLGWEPAGWTSVADTVAALMQALQQPSSR